MHKCVTQLFATLIQKLLAIMRCSWIMHRRDSICTAINISAALDINVANIQLRSEFPFKEVRKCTHSAAILACLPEFYF